MGKDIMFRDKFNAGNSKNEPMSFSMTAIQDNRLDLSKSSTLKLNSNLSNIYSKLI